MKRVLMLIGLILIGVLTYAGGDASAILLKVDNNNLVVKDKTADVEMVMINLTSGKEKVKKAELYQKGLDRKLFRYTYPESDKGIATLTIPDAVYLYLPIFKKPKKITNMAEGNAFNKSDFSLEDMNTKPYNELYTPVLIEENAESFILKLVPKENTTAYSFQIMTVNKKRYYPEKIEYFNKKGQKAKVAVYDYIKVSSYWIASTVSMTNIKKNHQTKFIMTNIKINKGLSDSVFTVKNMIPK